MAFETYTPLAVYPGDGSETTFPIPDKFYDPADIHVFLVDADGDESELIFGTDFSVVVTMQEPSPPGLKNGNVVLVLAPPVGTDVVPFILPPADQDQKFEGRPITPRMHERVHDRHSMRHAALLEFFYRGYRSPLNTAPGLRFIADGKPGRMATWDANGNLVEGPTVEQVDVVAQNIASVITVAGIAPQVVAVANIEAEIVGVYAVRAQIVTLAPIAGAIATLAPLDDELIALAPVAAEIAALGPIAAQIFTVAGISANVTTVAGIAAEVVAVAGNAANINAVAANAGNINIVAANETNINAVAAIDDDITAVAGAIPDIEAAVADLPNLAAKLNIEGSQLFTKADPFSSAFVRTGNGTVSLKGGTRIEVAGAFHVYAADTPITMPGSLAVGDYAFWAHPDGTLEATTDFAVGPVPFSRFIGCGHYAPGGGATGLGTGGNTTPQFNPYSLFDLKYHPSAPDWRGMSVVPGVGCVDMYMLGVDHHINGTSRNGVTIADGSSPPKIPAAFGGNGSSTYSTLTWWEAAEVMKSHGKTLMSVADAAAAFFGVVENVSRGNDPVTTGLGTTNAGSSQTDEKFTSKWFIFNATGTLWTWADEFGGGAAGASWANTNGGRGQVYQQSNAALLGSGWADGADAGSRASAWNLAPSVSNADIGARGRCDLVCHV